MDVHLTQCQISLMGQIGTFKRMVIQLNETPAWLKFECDTVSLRTKKTICFDMLTSEQHNSDSLEQVTHNTSAHSGALTSSSVVAHEWVRLTFTSFRVIRSPGGVGLAHDAGVNEGHCSLTCSLTFSSFILSPTGYLKAPILRFQALKQAPLFIQLAACCPSSCTNSSSNITSVMVYAWNKPPL